MAEAQKTSRGKEIRIKVKENTSMYEVYFYPGGRVPNALQGLFTSPVEAQEAIDAYYRVKGEK